MSLDFDLAVALRTSQYDEEHPRSGESRGDDGEQVIEAEDLDGPIMRF